MMTKKLEQSTKELRRVVITFLVANLLEGLMIKRLRRSHGMLLTSGCVEIERKTPMIMKTAGGYVETKRMKLRHQI
jgi:hypothetical protein